jgi:hypothetical protein
VLLLDPANSFRDKTRRSRLQCQPSGRYLSLPADCVFSILLCFVTTNNVQSYSNKTELRLLLCTRQIIWLHSVCVLPTCFTWGANILITRYPTTVLLCLFVILRITQVLISSV